MKQALTRHSNRTKKWNRNTEFEYDKEIRLDRCKNVLTAISKIKVGQGRVMYVFGAGKHARSSYRSLEKIQRVEIAYYYSVLPIILRPLSFVVASYAGIVKINDTNKLIEVFGTLVHSSIAGVYVLDKKIENEFINAVKRFKDINRVDEFIKERDKGYFIYRVDADNSESSTGVYEIVSYGIDCPENLINIL